MRQLAFLEPPTGAVIDVLDAGRLLQSRLLEQTGQPRILTMCHLAVDQETQALVEGQRLGRWLGELFLQGLRHAGQPELA